MQIGSEREATIASFEVRIVNGDQKPVKGARVRLAFSGIRGMTVEQYTYTDGVAGFSDHKEGEITVYVDGRDCGKYRYEDGGRITIVR